MIPQGLRPIKDGQLCPPFISKTIKVQRKTNKTIFILFQGNGFSYYLIIYSSSGFSTRTALKSYSYEDFARSDYFLF